jgi:hypothetical protein
MSVGLRSKFEPIRRHVGNRGKLGHASSKYSKNPGLKNISKLMAERCVRSVKPISNPASSVREALVKVARR